MVGMGADSPADLVYLVESTLPLLEDEISRTRTYLDQLESSHLEFTSFITRKRKLLSPVLRLPVDVLRLVFLRFAEDAEQQDADDTEYEPPDEDEDDSDYDSSSESDSMLGDEEDEVAGLAADLKTPLPPGYAQATWDPKWRRPARSSQWVLAQVCRRWRTVAFDYPSIWTSLCINLDLDLFHRHNTSYMLLESQLKMSKGLPLSIDFFSYSDTNEARSFLSLLASYAGQWRYADIVLPPALLPSLVDGGSFPALEKLSLSICSTSTVHTITMPRPLDVPSLREFHSFMNVPAVLQPIPQDWFAIPWTQLTTLSTSIAAADLPNIVPHLSSITDCDLIVADIDPEPAPPKKIHLPDLVRLSLLVRNEKSNLTILASLACPGLQQLTLSYADYLLRPKRCETTTHIELLYHFLRRSQCSILALHLPGSLSINTTKPLGIPFLESISSVEDVSLAINTSLEPLLSLGLLPNAHMVHLTSHSLDMPKVMTFLESRKDALHKCSVALWEFEMPAMGVMTDTMIRIQSLRMLGMDVRVSVNGQALP